MWQRRGRGGDRRGHRAATIGCEAAQRAPTPRAATWGAAHNRHQKRRKKVKKKEERKKKYDRHGQAREQERRRYDENRDPIKAHFATAHLPDALLAPPLLILFLLFLLFLLLLAHAIT